MKSIAAAIGLVTMAVSAPAAAQSVVGDWHGTLQAGGAQLPLAVHIEQGEDGALSGTMDSPSQGARGLALAEISPEPGTFDFTLPSVGGSYRGKWDAEAGRWKGEWRQGGVILPLELAAGPLPEAAEAPPPPLPENWTIPADDAIAALIDERNAPRAGQGMVVGVLGPDGTRIVARGPAGAEPFDGASLFEIGSISKVFTALLLADMADKGEVSLDDPAAKYLPAGHRMPERGRPITLKDLSQHVSGLPRLPDNMPARDPEDPYADYTEAELLAFLDRHQLQRDVGAQSEYSNLGVGLLGYLLARAAGTDYETLLAGRITGPLGMADTVVTLPAGARLVQGHDTFMRPARPWALPALVGAGGIRSTAADMLRFAEAVLDAGSPIAAAVATATAHRFDLGNPRAEQALGWQVLHPAPGREVLFHNGGTGGYRSALVIEPARRTAVVVLVNSAVEPSATDFATHLLTGAPLAPLQPIPPAPARRTEVTLPEAELERVVGRYDFGGGVEFVVTREDGELRAQRVGAATGPVATIYPEAPLKFFWKVVDAQVTFTTDDSGAVTGALFSQSGQELTGRRVAP